MKLLAIDTSTDIASVALKIEQDVFSEHFEDQKKQAQRILPVIHTLLSQADVKLDQLDGIVFGRGPGSFTGLRIACSIAKGLAYASNLPVYPVSTLQAIAAEVHNQVAEPVLAVLDARMQEWYWGYYSVDTHADAEYVSAAHQIELAEISPFILAGVGFESDLNALPDSIQKHCKNTMICYPQAATMIQLVEAGRISSVSAQKAEPSYIRNSVIQSAKTIHSGADRG